MTVATAAFIDRVRGRVRQAYGSAIGRPAHAVETPALMLDLATTKRNIALMAERLKPLPACLRPHIKVHKSPDLARMQVQAGAIGVSTATVWEALVMARSGVEHVLLVNQVTGAEKIRVLAELARDCDLLIAVDDAENAAGLSNAARRAGSTLGVLVDVDTGMGRAGVDTPEEALALTRRVSELPGLRFRGVTGYEGHCALIPEPAARANAQRAAMDVLVDAADVLAAGGFAVPIVSAGGTATWEQTASNRRVTEIQAGSYAVMDNFHAPMAGGFEKALTVLTTVTSRASGQVIVDAGNKSIGGIDQVTMVGHNLPAVRFDEEHGVFEAPRTSLRVGDVVELTPGYSPSTVNWYDAYHVVDGGLVVDIWPVIPRGPGHGGLLCE